MGGALDRLMGSCVGGDGIRVVLVGLDSSGKTTLLYRLKMGETISTIPTKGFNVEVVLYKRTKFTIWDGSMAEIRAQSREYFENTQAIIFVVDSTATELFGAACFELHKLFTLDELREASLVVCANKQDLPNAAGLEEIGDKLRLNKIPSSRKFCILPTSAHTGAGLQETLAALLEAFNES